MIARYDDGNDNDGNDNDGDDRAGWPGVAAVARKPDLYVPLIVLLRPIPRIVYREIHFAFTCPDDTRSGHYDLIRTSRYRRSNMSKISAQWNG